MHFKTRSMSVVDDQVVRDALAVQMAGAQIQESVFTTESSSSGGGVHDGADIGNVALSELEARAGDSGYLSVEQARARA